MRSSRKDRREGAKGAKYLSLLRGFFLCDFASLRETTYP